MPPPKMNPAPASDLVVLERGARLLLGFTYPKTTVSGMTLSGIEAVEVWAKTGIAPLEGEPKPIDPREFEGEAKRVATLKGDQLSAAIHGDQVRLDFPLERFTPTTPSAAETATTSAPAAPSGAKTSAADTAAGETRAGGTVKEPESAATTAPSAPARPALWIAVRTVSTRGDRSPFSNQATLVPAAAPAPPRALKADAEASGIALSWSDEDKDVQGFRVYRRLSSEHGYGSPLALVKAGRETSYLDASASFGQRYTYTVVAVSSASPFVESAPGGETEVDYQDHFPPPVPQRLVALPTRSQVRLLWEASPAEDLLGYVVERRSAGSETWERLTAKPEGATRYDDRAVEPGASYDYRILAVDANGNASAPSAPASATVPGS